ncbi:MAG: NAD(P)/FAD-dependent oxidoreductase [Lacibacter sp.]
MELPPAFTLVGGFLLPYSSMKQKELLVVVGGGAAGFFCAVNAARMAPQLRVLLLERSAKLLSKVKVSGGGRCNVTHACFDIDAFSRNYYRGSRFVRKALHRFFVTDTIAWFEQRGVRLKTEADGRMFPVTDQSQTIIDCLLREAEKYAVEVRLHTDVTGLQRAGDGWQVYINANQQPLKARFVCVATGGYPKAAQFAWLQDTQHTLVPPVPSLFTFNVPNNAITQLMGVTVPLVTVKVQGSKLRQSGPLLITHWGFSGPAILRLSAAGARELHDGGYHFHLLVNWLHEATEAEVKQRFQALRTDKGAATVLRSNPFSLPQRLWEYLVQQAGIAAPTRWAELQAALQNRLVQLLVQGSFEVQGKTTFKEEFVTAGGIDLKEVDANTMQSRIAPGLYFAGEVLDVDGVTGGFNFQHAWTSGYIAAADIARRVVQPAL